jgi:DNA-directed RNA polymerase II subunit RPB2
VISAYFDEKGLVRQQLDSFNNFAFITIQELIDETEAIRIKTQTQHKAGEPPQDVVRPNLRFLAIFFLPSRTDFHPATRFPHLFKH